jgi:hypothetical protein
MFRLYVEVDPVARMAMEFPKTGFTNAGESECFSVAATIYLLDPGSIIFTDEEPDFSPFHLHPLSLLQHSETG